MICRNGQCGIGVKESTIKDVLLKKSWKHVNVQVGGDPPCLTLN